MGTRADFYVGRGPQAEWLGSIAWDGYPSGVPQLNSGAISSEADYRAAVELVLSEAGESATRPEQGWPWPWDNSNTTDYTYAFDEGRVWGTSFGHGWWPIESEPEEDLPTPKITDWPDMSARKSFTMGPRSGLIVVTAKGVQ